MGRNIQSSKKIQEKGKKEVFTEDSNKPDKNPKSYDEKSPQYLKRSTRKRKMEGKEVAKDNSILEEVQNIKRKKETVTNPEIAAESPAKSKVAHEEPKNNEANSSVAEDENLPKGWVRKAVIRKSGKTAGQVDIYIYSPDGNKFRSRPDVAAYLARTNSNLKLDSFNFSKKTNSSNSAVTPSQKKPTSTKPKITTKERRAMESVNLKNIVSSTKGKEKNAKKSTSKPAKQIKTSEKASGTSRKASKKNKNV